MCACVECGRVCVLLCGFPQFCPGEGADPKDATPAAVSTPGAPAGLNTALQKRKQELGETADSQPEARNVRGHEPRTPEGNRVLRNASGHRRQVKVRCRVGTGQHHSSDPGSECTATEEHSWGTGAVSLGSNANQEMWRNGGSRPTPQAPLTTTAVSGRTTRGSDSWSNVQEAGRLHLHRGRASVQEVCSFPRGETLHTAATPGPQ